MTVRMVLKLSVLMLMLKVSFPGLAQASPYGECRWKKERPPYERR